MSNILFEIEAENWQKVYEISTKSLEDDSTNSFYWYLRALSCFALTDDINDKSKEMLASIKKISKDGADFEKIEVEFFRKIIEKRAKFWKQKFDEAADSSRSTGKWDNLTTEDFVAQRMTAKVDKKTFARKHSEKAINVLNAVKHFLSIYDEKEGDRKAVSLFLDINWFVHYGFDKSSNYEEMRKILLEIRERCLRHNPEGKYELGDALAVMFGRSKTKSGGCYIATATYGSYNHPIVLDLRNFRDFYLKKSKSGRTFIKVYYFISPSIAKIIEKNKLLKYLSLTLIVKPVHKISKILLK